MVEWVYVEPVYSEEWDQIVGYLYKIVENGFFDLNLGLEDEGSLGETNNNPSFYDYAFAHSYQAIESHNPDKSRIGGDSPRKKSKKY